MTEIFLTNKDKAALEAIIAAKADKAALEVLKSSEVKTAIGSYVGTGTYGKANPNTLTFDFKPKFLIIHEGTNFLFANYGCTRIQLHSIFAGNCAANPQTFSWNDKTVSWYIDISDTGSNYSPYQLNAANTTYYFIAIG